MKLLKTANAVNTVAFQDESMEKGILIVDDSKFSRNILKDILKNEGFNVIAEAKNGLEAVEMTKQKKPEYIFMDVEMPILDGLGAIPKILEVDPFVHIIMCTAMGQKNIIVEAARAGAKDYVLKPYKKENIIRVLSVLKEANQKDGQIIPFKGGKKHQEEVLEVVSLEEEFTEDFEEEYFEEEVPEEEYLKEEVPVEEVPEEQEIVDKVPEVEDLLEKRLEEEKFEEEEEFEEEKFVEEEEFVEEKFVEEGLVEEGLEEEGLEEDDAEEQILEPLDIEGESAAFTELVSLEFPILGEETDFDTEGQILEVQTEAYATQEEKTQTIKEDKKPYFTVPAENPEALKEEEKSESTVPAENPEALKEEEKSEATVSEENPETIKEEEKSEATVPAENPEALKEEEKSEATVSEENPETIKEEEKLDFAVQQENPEALKEVKEFEQGIRDQEVNLEATSYNCGFAYLWENRFDIRQEGFFALSPANHRLPFYNVIHLTRDGYGLLDRNNSDKEIMSGIIKSYLRLGNRLQSEEPINEVQRNTCPIGIRLFTNKILEGECKDRTEITIADILKLSGNKEQQCPKVFIQNTSLSSAMLNLVQGKANRLLG